MNKNNVIVDKNGVWSIEYEGKLLLESCVSGLATSAKVESQELIFFKE